MNQPESPSFKENYTQLRVIGPQAWIFILAILIGGGAALIWAIFGSIRQSVTASAVVTYPEGLLSIYSPNTERLKEVYVKPGDKVKQGDILARLEDKSEQIKLDKDRKLLEIAIENNNRLLTYNSNQINTIKTKTSELNDVYRPLKDSATALYQKKLITASDIANTDKEYFDNINSLNQKYEDLLKQQQTINEDMVEKKLNFKTNESQLKEKYLITSPYSGTVSDINYLVGQYPLSDTPIITIQNSKSKSLIVMAVASSGDADRVRSGDQVLFTPANVERSRYGGIFGTVKSVSREPVSPQNIINFVGNKKIGEKLSSSDSLYKIMITLEKRKGYVWSSGDGPKKKNIIFANLLGKATIYYEERSPIGYVLPFMRSLIGLDNNTAGK